MRTYGYIAEMVTDLAQRFQYRRPSETVTGDELKEFVCSLFTATDAWQEEIDGEEEAVRAAEQRDERI